MVSMRALLISNAACVTWPVRYPSLFQRTASNRQPIAVPPERRLPSPLRPTVDCGLHV
jgi:hypothetical protein